MSDSAQRFITPLTLQTLSKNPVMTAVFAGQEGWCPGHIELADRADLLLIAPASAAALARLACGLAEDALTCVALATRAPLLIAPAMNGKMWSHPRDRAKHGGVARPRRDVHRTRCRSARLRIRRCRAALAR